MAFMAKAIKCEHGVITGWDVKKGDGEIELGGGLEARECDECPAPTAPAKRTRKAKT